MYQVCCKEARAHADRQDPSAHRSENLLQCRKQKHCATLPIAESICGHSFKTQLHTLIALHAQGQHLGYTLPRCMPSLRQSDASLHKAVRP